MQTNSDLLDGSYQLFKEGDISTKIMQLIDYLRKTSKSISVSYIRNCSLTFAWIACPICIQDDSCCMDTITFVYQRQSESIAGLSDVFMGINNLTANVGRIVSYCKTSKRKPQIMRDLNLNELEIEAYTAILIRQRLLEQNFNGYQTTPQGSSYLDTRDKVEIALRK